MFIAPKEPEKPPEPEAPQDPKDCKIVAGRDTTIEFQKDKDKGIGFIIAGGSDTPLVNFIFFLLFSNKNSNISTNILILNWYHWIIHSHYQPL